MALINSFTDRCFSSRLRFKLPAAPRGLLSALVSAACMVTASRGGEPDFSPPSSGPVFIGSIGELRQRVLDANWNIQAKIMEYEIKRRTEEAAKGQFSPLLAASYNYEDSNRPNTVE